jgi:hypothetical protein
MHMTHTIALKLLANFHSVWRFSVAHSANQSSALPHCVADTYIYQTVLAIPGGLFDAYSVEL